MERRGWLILPIVAAVCGCPSEPPDEAACEPIDLTVGRDALRIGFAVTELRLLGEILEFGLSARSSDCPVLTGPAMDDPITGTHTWTGGCDGNGVRFEGTLTRTWDRSVVPAVVTTAAERWSAVGNAPGFTALEFDGTWTQTSGWVDDERREDTAEGTFRLTGSKRGHLDGTNFPQGVTGTYDWSGDWDEDPQIHRFSADVEVVCRGALVAEVEVLDTIAGGCPNSVPEGGTMELQAGGHAVDVDFADSTDCSGCWPWDLDGERRPGLACSSGGF